MKVYTRHIFNKEVHIVGAELPMRWLYPFFLVHMLAFGSFGFYLSYTSEQIPTFVYYFECVFAIFSYLIFYWLFFDFDKITWMFINGALGLLGIYSQIGWLLSLFGKEVSDYPIQRHICPVIYYVMYTFLLRNAVLDLTRSREDVIKKKYVEYGYVVILVTIYLVSYYFHKH